MSQHDYNLANAAGASFRADANDALGAIATNNSGATAPATTFAYQWWADTSSGWLKQRNAANSAWIERFPLAAARADVASAATLDLDAATSAWLRITGTTTVTAVTLADGSQRWAVAQGAFALTHGASLIVQGAASFTTAAGDLLHFIGEAAGVVRVEIQRANGTPVTSSSSVRAQDFRLTLTSGLPVTTADVTGATTIYCAPYKGNQISLYDGASWVTRTSAEFSKALGTLTSGKAYDVYCYDNAGTPTLEFLVWTSDTTRGTALAYQDGILVKSGDATRRYMGTFYTTSTTQTEDSASKRYLYNYYHRVSRHLSVVDTTNSWIYTGAAWQQARATATNQVEFLQGVAEDDVEAEVAATTQTGTGSTAAVAVGLDSTTPVSQVRAAAAVSGTIYVPVTARYRGVPAAGRHALLWLEYGNGTAVTFYGDNGATIMQSGMTARVMA